MKNFLTAHELKDHLDSYIVIDCRGSLTDHDAGFCAYKESHIPGALFLDVHTDLSGSVSTHGGRHPLPPLQDFVAKIESFGIINSSKIVIYDDWIFGAARLWWMLKYIGLDHVYLLLGGFPSWQKEIFPLEQGLPNHQIISSQITIIPQHALLATYEDMVKFIHTKERIIVDSREPRRYRGEYEPIDKKAGHIPGAINIFYEDAYTANSIKSHQELQNLFAPLVNTTSAPVIYCGSGISAPVNILAMDEVGIKTTLYLGSFSDWISYEDAPLATGEEND